MIKFKVGDKVVRASNPTLAIEVGAIDAVVCCYSGGGITLANHPSTFTFKDYYFELYKEEPKVKQFDIKKDAWFISTPTEESSKLAQEWLFDQGLIWQGYEDTNIHLAHTKALMSSNYTKGEFCWSGPVGIIDKPEIILTYKTVIDTITFPVLEEPESEAQKQLKVLKEQIAELSKQAEVLEGSL